MRRLSCCFEGLPGGALWGAAMLVMLWRYPEPSPALFTLSLAFPVYYVGLSLVLQTRQPRSRPLGSGLGRQG